MATIYGIADTEIIPQSDFTAGQNENLGWTARQSFLVKKGGIDNSVIASKFPIGVKLNTLDPNCDEFFARLWLSSISSVQTMEGGYTVITCEFSGFSTATYAGGSPNKDTSPTFAKRGNLTDEPLSKHHKWKALAEVERNTLGKLISGEWSYILDPFGSGDYVIGVFTGEEQYSVRPDSEQLISDDAKEFARLITEGQTTFKHASYEYTHRWDSDIPIPAADMNDLGKIATPSGDPPKPGTGRNWMLVGVNEEQHGAGDFRFSCELVYALSEEEGFSTFLYE